VYAANVGTHETNWRHIATKGSHADDFVNLRIP
jgi:hypothetical protein